MNIFVVINSIFNIQYTLTLNPITNYGIITLITDKLKPCVSHRDLNTRNILVKTDLSCCLCDLGFAMKISGSKYFYNGEEQHAETKSITDVSN